MNQSQNPQSQPSLRQPRRRLIQGPAKVRPSPPAEMANAYNEAYRRKQLGDGKPDRRVIAEAFMQAVLENLMIPVPPAGMEDPEKAKRDSAKALVVQTAAILRSLVDAEHRPTYNNSGIGIRIKKICDAMEPAGRRTRSAAT